MATQYIEKKADGVSAIADDATGRAIIRNIGSKAAGFIYDRVANLIKYNGNDAVKTLVSEDGTQTLTNKTLSGAVITPARVEYDADGAIGITSHIAVLISSDAGAYTIAAPTAEGQVIDIVSETSAAHVITGTNLFWAGVTGGPFNKLTLTAFPGYHARLISSNGLWMVLAAALGTGTVGD